MTETFTFNIIYIYLERFSYNIRSSWESNSKRHLDLHLKEWWPSSNLVKDLTRGLKITKDHLLKTITSWNFDFSWNKTSSTCRDIHCPGHNSLNSLNQPSLIKSIVVRECRVINLPGNEAEVWSEHFLPFLRDARLYGKTPRLDRKWLLLRRPCQNFTKGLDH